jgi:flagellar biogenesis protein FliO
VSCFRGARILVLMVMLLPASAWAAAQTRPTAQNKSAVVSSDESLESSPLFGESTSPGSSKTSPANLPSGSMDFTRVGLALGGVVALIFILRVFIRRIVPGAVAHRASSTVKILGRCPVSPKQNILVVQFGKRLVLVGDSGASLNPLCEVSDSDEVASIIAQNTEETISVARRFESLFGRARKDFDGPGESESAESFDNSHEVKPEDPSLQETQKELSELREKVRDVARQIESA